ncbi:DUF4296 domain-containing protein [Flavobacteriaceae bacterium]|nr:DUF4296 domain-containing protein [Flavobacteriaceae bacterium]
MKKIAVLWSAILVISCGNIKAKKPANLISEDRMVEVLYDVIIINTAKGVNKQLLQNNINNPINYIYRSHGIDSLQFAESNAYYTINTDKYKSIYDKVEMKLKAEKSQYEAIVGERKRVKDSIKKSKQNQIDTTMKAAKKGTPSKGVLNPLRKFDSLRK